MPIMYVAASLRGGHHPRDRRPHITYVSDEGSRGVSELRRQHVRASPFAFRARDKSRRSCPRGAALTTKPRCQSQTLPQRPCASPLVMVSLHFHIGELVILTVAVIVVPGSD